MMKKSTMSVMESSPSSSSGFFPVPIRQESRVRFQSFPVAAEVGDGARARLKHQALLQDYLELLKETEQKKKKLLEMNQKKCQLMAEVKFLRRKYTYFAKNPRHETPFLLLKKQSHGMSSMSVQSAQPPNTKQTLKEAKISRTPGLLDLNQISLPSAEEMQECPMEWESLKADHSKRFLIEGATMTNGFKRSVVRDVGNGSSKIAKRKISWRDQVALRA